MIGFVFIELTKLTRFGFFSLEYTGGKISIMKKNGAASNLYVLNLLIGFMMITNQ
jgi:hypothetical protein